MKAYLIIAIIMAGLGLIQLPAQSKPNIVFILADDMGYADLSSYGSPDSKTPNIDKLAAEGVKFTNFYANGQECSPSRTAFLTGRYPQRVGGLECAIGTGNVGRYDDAIRLADNHDLGLPKDLAVLAPTLKKAGYRNAVFGKWHMGYEAKFNPLDQGFDEFVGFLGGNVDYFHHVELSDLPVYYSGRKPVKREGFTTHLITDDAIDFLNRHKAKPDEPFFLYVPHAAPHFPFQIGTIMDRSQSFMTIAGGKPPEGMASDGIDIINHVVQGKEDQLRTLFWRARRGDRSWWAVRSCDLKYVKKTEGGKTEEWLFDLVEDPEEQENRLDSVAGKSAAAVLIKKLTQWENEVKPVR